MVRRKKKEAIREQARALRQEMIVRYRSDGHIRFQLPSVLCVPNASDVFHEELHKVEGVYRVLTYQRVGKLSVRYISDVCALRDLALALDNAVERVLDDQRDASTSSSDEGGDGLFAPLTAPWRRIKARYENARNKAKAVYDLMASHNKLMSKVPFDPEGWAITFANDLVVFYLVKVHWERITKFWLPNPIKYRYQWMTVFYLTFLLVRYRRKQNAMKAQLTKK